MLKLLLGDPNARKLKRFQPIVSDINVLEEDIAPLSDDQLRGLTAEFRQKLETARGVGGSSEAIAARERKLLDDLLPQAFAVVREAGMPPRATPPARGRLPPAQIGRFHAQAAAG